MMNDKSQTAQATLERKPAPEIQDTRSQAGHTLALAGNGRRPVRSRGGGPSVDPSDGGQRMNDATFAVETIELDAPAVAAALSQRLHAAGLPVTPERAVNLAQALILVGPVSRRQLYCTARAVFVSSPAHVPAFDRVFVSVFGGSGLNADEGANNATSVENRRHPEDA